MMSTSGLPKYVFVSRRCWLAAHEVSHSPRALLGFKANLPSVVVVSSSLRVPTCSGVQVVCLCVAYDFGECVVHVLYVDVAISSVWKVSSDYT